MFDFVRLLIAAAVLSGLTGIEVVAQDPSEGESDSTGATNLENVVVTAQFREQAPVEVPIAVSNYDQRFLDDTGLDQLDSLSAFVPGLLVQEQSVNNPGFVIRGITSDDGASTIEPRVSIYQNGVSISRSRGSFVELFDLERIEILKGPQGTLLGRSAQIGAVHIISQKPRFQTEARLRAELGNFDQTWFEGMVNVPLVDNRLAFRAAAVHRKRDGFIENATGTDLNGTDTTALRTSLRWLPADNTTVDVIANVSEDSPPGTSFKSGVIPALGGDTDPHTFASLNTFGGLIGGRELGTNRDIFDVTGIVEGKTLDRRHFPAKTQQRPWTGDISHRHFPKRWRIRCSFPLPGIRRLRDAGHTASSKGDIAPAGGRSWSIWRTAGRRGRR